MIDKKTKLSLQTNPRVVTGLQNQFLILHHPLTIFRTRFAEHRKNNFLPVVNFF